jgi:hypothetical protein
MTPYIAVLCVHVVVAVLGLGQVAGMLVVARGTDESVVEYLGGGAFHESLWFRLSFGLLLLLGAINGATGRALRRRNGAPSVPILPRVRRAAWTMCALVTLVTILMEAKPW